MSKAIDILMAEHRIIEQVLSSLGSFAEMVRGGGGDREQMIRFAEFFRTYADYCHHGKEEKILFEEMVRCGVPIEGGPIGCMLHEHDDGRAAVREIAEIGSGIGPLSEGERTHMHRASTRFVELLRQHIQKEDEILYPMAEKLLPGDVMDQMSARFDAFEQEEMGLERQQQMLALANELSQIRVEK